MPIWCRDAFVSALALSLLHSLWQGAILGLFGVALNKRLRSDRPEVRYGAYSLLLFTVFGVWLGTFCMLYAASARTDSLVPGAPAALGIATMMAALPQSPADLRTISLLRPLYPMLVGCWALGVCLLSMRHLGGSLLLHRLFRTATAQCPAAWSACAQTLSAKMGISQAVLVRCSSHIDVPCAFGVFRSCVLLPLGAMAGLTTAQVEALIAHELAHLACHDVLFNTIQVVIETVLFYHPAVRWLSLQIRIAREQRCDDLAIQAIGGNRAVYARALFALEEARTTIPHLALGARGDGSTASNAHLAGRIRRVLGVSVPERRDPWTKGIVALGSTAVVLATFHSGHAGTPTLRKNALPHAALANSASHRNQTATATKEEEIVRSRFGGKDMIEVIPDTGTIARALKVKRNSSSIADLHLNRHRRVIYVHLDFPHRGNRSPRWGIGKPYKMLSSRGGEKSTPISHITKPSDTVGVSIREGSAIDPNTLPRPTIPPRPIQVAANPQDDIRLESVEVQPSIAYIRIADASEALPPMPEKTLQTPFRIIRYQDAARIGNWKRSATGDGAIHGLVGISTTVRAHFDFKGNRTEVESMDETPITLVYVDGKPEESSNLDATIQMELRNATDAEKTAARADVDMSVSKTITDLVRKIDVPEEVKTQIIGQIRARKLAPSEQNPADRF